MKQLYLTVSLLLAAYCCLYAQEATQISGDNPHYIISVTHGGNAVGDIEIELFPDIAPLHCKNFDSLVSIKFYDGTAFHRVIPGFMIQGGDPNSRSGPKSTWGYGDPSQKTVPAEFSTKSHLRGIMSAARTPDPNSATSQFFICVAAATHLDGQYSVHGQVVKGMSVADYIVGVPRDGNNNPLDKVAMTIVKVDPSGVHDVAVDNGIRIYPNPAVSNLRFIAETGGFTVTEWQINDITGTVHLQNASVNLNINDLSIPIAGLPTGAYMLTMKDAGNVIHAVRFVAQ